MFADLLSRLMASEPAPLDDSDARLSLCALLVRVARADGHYDSREADQIERVLCARFDLTQAAAAQLRKDGEQLEIEAPDTVRFTRAIKDAVDYDDRKAVIESLWQIALSDGTRDSHEETLLRMVASFLGVNDRDSALARQRVSAKT